MKFRTKLFYSFISLNKKVTHYSQYEKLSWQVSNNLEKKTSNLDKSIITNLKIKKFSPNINTKN